MSMSMYRPTKVFPTNIVEQRNCPSKHKGKAKSEVRRSNSLPFSLSGDSREDMDTANEKATGAWEMQSSRSTTTSRSIPEEKVFSSFQLADSIHSDGDDFFLPMDDSTACEDGDEPNLQPYAHRVSAATGLVDQERKQHAAILRLEHFFLGDSCDVAPKAKENSSPVAVMDLAFQSSPKRNMFGHIIEDVTHRPLQRMSQSAEETSYDETPTFSKLKLSDRAHSLPLTLNTFNDSLPICGADSLPLKVITKKPSLKKISSIGTGMSKRIASEGNFHRTVSFSSLSIREYPPAISDNPSCSFGPPVQLDWEYEAEQTHPIDLYEQSRQPRRASHDLLLSYYDRRFLLIKQAGYSRKEVTEAMKAADRVKRERMLTDLFLPAQALDETVENFLDFVKRFFSKSDSATMEPRG